MYVRPKSGLTFPFSLSEVRRQLEDGKRQVRNLKNRFVSCDSDFVTEEERCNRRDIPRFFPQKNKKGKGVGHTTEKKGTKCVQYYVGFFFGPWAVKEYLA